MTVGCGLQLGSAEVIAVDVEGNSEIITQVPTTIPFSIDWLPDGTLLIVSGREAQLLRREPGDLWLRMPT